MKIFLLLPFILFFLLFFACSKETKFSGSETTHSSVSGINGSGQDSNLKNLKSLTDSVGKTNEVNFGNIDYRISEVPPGLKYIGKVVAMAKWKDKSGNNLLFISVTDVKSEGVVKDNKLFAYHYILHVQKNKQLWKIYDLINDCPADVTLDYIEGSLIVTDLNKNGIGENSFLYKMSCKGDVSADELKLIMHEGERKYAIRGTMNLVMNGQDLEKGNSKIDASFDKAPAGFREFAKDRWNKFKTEKTGEQ